MNEVVKRLKEIILQSSNTIYQPQNENLDNTTNTTGTNVVSNSINNLSHGELSRLIENFNRMNTGQIICENSLSEKDLSIVISEAVKFIFKMVEKGKEKKFRKQYTLDYFNNYNINSKEIYNWLLNNQTGSASIFLLGYFNFYGIEVDKNYEKAFNLFINASDKDHALSEYYIGECYLYGYGTTKNENFAFKYYAKLANNNSAIGKNSVGYCYCNGFGVGKD